MGLKFVKKIRDVDQHTKIIIVSARDGVQDRILGLKLGADDYLTKPFDLEEFYSESIIWENVWEKNL